MIQVNPSRVRLLAATICAGVLLISGALPVGAQLARKLTFKELVENSDAIFVGTCIDRKSVLKDGKIVTQYHLQPSEFWKGKATLSKDGQLTMEELGGQLSGPVPVGQAVPGMADMAPEEEVLLFCKQAAAPSPRQLENQARRTRQSSAVSTESLQIVGRWQGRFAVFHHPETGQRLVVKATGNSVPGAAINPEFRKMMIEQNQRVATAQKLQKARKAGMTADSQQTQAVDTFLLNSHELGQKIDKASRRAKADLEARAVKFHAEADDIYLFEPMDAIKGRVMRTMTESKK